MKHVLLIVLSFLAFSAFSNEAEELPCMKQAIKMGLNIAVVDMPDTYKGMKKTIHPHFNLDPTVKSFTMNFVLDFDGEEIVTGYDIKFKQHDEGGTCYLESVHVKNPS